MGIQQGLTPQHWRYFLALEEDVARMARYVEFSTHNFDTYSIELARLLSVAAAEVDVVAKQLCEKLSGTKGADSIAKYQRIIHVSYPQFTDTLVLVPRFGLTLQPWEQWANGNKPFWWAAYNNVKHHRHTHFSDASLKNALNSVAALFVLLLYFYRDEAEGARLIDPVFFRAGAPFHTDYPAYSDGRALVYCFPNQNA